ncbi:MAG: hypothetical protein WCT49_03150 [Candidatus Paceibacterota bacterium]|jgi:hypothetical protein|nr:hypothetical protein [Candidatus Paceibacterota bacterium]
MKTAVIIKGNPKFITDNPDADRFYCEIKRFLEGEGYSVTFDHGEAYTQPPDADVWIGHSRGNDRLRFATGGTKTIMLSTVGGINHPEDKALSHGVVPDKFHYILTEDMKEKIKEKLMVVQK